MNKQTDSTRFLEAAHQILSVSKTEIMKREAADKKQRAAAKKAK
jgi:hypothetical protein